MNRLPVNFGASTSSATDPAIQHRLNPRRPLTTSIEMASDDVPQARASVDDYIPYEYRLKYFQDNIIRGYPDYMIYYKHLNPLSPRAPPLMVNLSSTLRNLDRFDNYRCICKLFPANIVWCLLCRKYFCKSCLDREMKQNRLCIGGQAHMPANLSDNQRLALNSELAMDCRMECNVRRGAPVNPFDYIEGDMHNTVKLCINYKCPTCQLIGHNSSEELNILKNVWAVVCQLNDDISRFKDFIDKAHKIYYTKISGGVDTFSDSTTTLLKRIPEIYREAANMIGFLAPHRCLAESRAINKDLYYKNVQNGKLIVKLQNKEELRRAILGVELQVAEQNVQASQARQSSVLKDAAKAVSAAADVHSAARDLENQLHLEKMKSDRLQMVCEDREYTIARLNEDLERLKLEKTAKRCVFTPIGVKSDSKQYFVSHHAVDLKPIEVNDVTTYRNLKETALKRFKVLDPKISTKVDLVDFRVRNREKDLNDEVKKHTLSTHCFSLMPQNFIPSDKFVKLKVSSCDIINPLRKRKKTDESKEEETSKNKKRKKD